MGRKVADGEKGKDHKRKLARPVSPSEMERSQEYLDIAGVMILVIDADEKVSLINKKGCEILGYRKEEILGKNWFDNFLPKRHKGEVKEVFSKLITGMGELVEYFENPVLTKNGEEGVIAWHNTLLRDQEGNIIGTLSSGEDITRRKQTEKEMLLLQETNYMLNAGFSQEEVLNNIAVGLRKLYKYDSVAIQLLESDRKHLILKSYSSSAKAAKKLEKLTGLTLRGHVIPLYKGSILTEIVNTKKPVITDDIIWVLKSYTDKKSLQAMARGAARVTKARWGMGVPLLAGNKVVGIIGCGSVKKLTNKDSIRLGFFGTQAGLAIEKAQTHERLKAAYKEIEQSNQLKDLFIDIMRHDLLNPAGFVRGMSQLALENEKDPDQKDLLQRIFNSNEKIIKMIENASKLAKLESGDKLDFEEDELGKHLRNAAMDMSDFADERNVKIELPQKGSFPASLNPLIQDVFSNLLNNAIKYGPQESEVKIHIEDCGRFWKVSMSDNGPGIPDKDKASVFERFSRIKKGSVKGTGLGLAIVKRIVKAHKGRVWVEDNPKGGSIFNVEIPKRHNEAKS